MHSSDLKTNKNHPDLSMLGYATIVGEYREDGTKVSDGAFTNPEAKAKLDKMFALSAAMGGGELIPKVAGKTPKPKKAKKRAVKLSDEDPEPLTPLLTQRELDNEPSQQSLEESFERMQTKIAVKRQSVYLHNKMGKIKLQVESVLESEMAYCLVFSDDDAVIFTPNAGETLNFTDQNGETTPVYYADTLFTWTDGVKKIMILFKTKDE